MDQNVKAVAAVATAIVTGAGALIAAVVHFSDEKNRAHAQAKMDEAGKATGEFFANLNPFKGEAKADDKPLIKLVKEEGNVKHYEVGPLTVSVVAVSDESIEFCIWRTDSGETLTASVFDDASGMEWRGPRAEADSRLGKVAYWVIQQPAPEAPAADPAEEAAIASDRPAAIALLQSAKRTKEQDHALAEMVFWSDAHGKIVAMGLYYPSKPDKCFVQVHGSVNARFDGEASVELLLIGREPESNAQAA